MKTRLPAITAAFAASCLALGAPVFAAPSAETHLPGAHTVGKVTYISGGVGQNEADAIEHVARNYPLELEFVRKAKPRDEYLADVKVHIKDAQNRMVLDVPSTGPFLLARLPAGKYTVSAEHDGKLENRQVQVSPGNHRRIVFEWQA